MGGVWGDKGGDTGGGAATRRAAYLALAVLTAMNLLNYIDRYILAAVIPTIGKEFPLSETQKGWVGSAFLIGYVLFSPLVGWLGDRLPRRWLLAAGVGVWSLATVATGLAQDFEHLLLTRGFLGLGEATYAILAPALIADLFPRASRNRALTIFYVAIPIGAAFGYALGGFVDPRWGWRNAFYFVGLPGLAAALLAFTFREPPRGAAEDVSDDHRRRLAEQPLTWQSYASLRHNRSYVRNTLGMAMYTFSLGGLQYWTPNFLQSDRGFTTESAGLMLGAAVGLSGLVGTAAGGLLADRLAARGVRGHYFLACGLPMLASAPVILAALFLHVPAAIFAAILVGLTLALMNTGPSNTILVNVTPPRMRAAAVAVNLFLIHLLGDIPSPVLIGTVAQTTGSLLLGLLLTVPPLLLSGFFFCRGAAYLEADQEAALRPPTPDTGLA